MAGFQGQTVWITGASSGIGEALAYELASRGARLILTARNEAELNRVKNACARPETHSVEPMDLGRYHELEAKAEAVWQRHGPIDVLVNNAGVSQRYRGLESSLALDEKIMGLNFFGTVALTRPILKRMAERDSGHIAVVSSVLGLYGIQTRTAYSASKHALKGYFDSLRNELFRTGVKITMIYPGYVTTKVSHNALAADGKPYGKLDEGHRRGVRPEDCARKMADAIARGRREVVIAGPKEYLGVLTARYLPRLFARISPRLPV